MSLRKARQLLDQADMLRAAPLGQQSRSERLQELHQLHIRAFVEAADIARKRAEPPLSLGALADGLERVARDIARELNDAPQSAQEAMLVGLVRSRLAFPLGQLEGMATGIRAHLPVDDRITITHRAETSQ